MSLSADTSASLLGSLGLEEVEPWIVEDSFENRRTLRQNKLMWDTVPGEDGLPSGLIRAFDPETLTARRETVWESRKPIMVDETNPWSDYISVLEYPVDVDVPFWIRTRANRWVEQKVEGVPEEKRIALPVRCRVVRTDGTRCWNWVSRKNTDKCKQHLGWQSDQDVAKVQVARTRILQASVRAVEVLEELSDSAEGEAVRLKASTEILDRAGVRGGVEIDMHATVEQVDPSAEVRERLSRLAERLQPKAELESGEDIVEAEVVEEKETETHDAE